MLAQDETAIDAKDNLLGIGLFLMECVFEKSHRTPRLAKVHRVIVFISVSILGSLTLVNFLHAKEIPAELFLRTLETFITEYHVTNKYILYIINKKVLSGFMDSMNDFWPIDIAEPELKAQLENTYRVMFKFLSGLAVVAFGTVFTFFLQPIYNESPMMMEIWLPSDNPLINAVVWFMESHTLIVALLVVIGTDSLYFAFCTHLYVQLQLLQQEYKNLLVPRDCTRTEEAEARRKFKKCVQHHQFLLRFFSGMRQVYSLLFLAQFFSTLLSTCMELFILSTNSESIDIAEVINKFFYVITLLWQFGLYCFPAEYITAELKNISDAVYHSKWYDSKTNFCKELAMIMAASQRQAAFTAGGFSDVNISTFTTVFKLSFSFYTVMRTVFGKGA